MVILYISPTRALANDLFRRLETVFDQLGVSIGVQHGERKDLNRVVAPGVLITTPESLDVMVGKRHDALREVRAVVLDEVHLLMNTQRGLQCAIALHRLELLLERSVQAVGLSATLGDPAAVWQFFRPSTTAEVIDDSSTDRSLNVQVREAVTPDDLAALLGRLSQDQPMKVLVFVNARRVCDRVAEVLKRSECFGDACLRPPLESGQGGASPRGTGVRGSGPSGLCGDANP